MPSIVVCSHLYGSHRSYVLLPSDKWLHRIPIRRRWHSLLAMGVSHSLSKPILSPTTVSSTLLSRYPWCLLLHRHYHFQIAHRLLDNQNHGPVCRIPHLAYLLRHDIHSFPTCPCRTLGGFIQIVRFGSVGSTSDIKTPVR